MTSKISDEVVARFAQIDTACIGDVLHARGLRCISQGLFPLAGSMKVCGPAVTLRQITARDGLNRARHEQVLVEMCGPGDVLVMDAGGRTEAAPWGGNIAIDAKNRGLSGAVIDGGCRDTREIAELGFATFVRGRTTTHTHGYFHTVCMNSEPVQIGGPPMPIMVAPGDLVVGDTDGVVVVPAELAEEMVELAERRHAIDEEMRDELLAGKGHGDPEVDEVIARMRRAGGVEQVEGYRW